MATVATSGQVTVDDTGATIFSGFSSQSGTTPQVAVKNLGPVDVFVGPSGVTPTTGYPLAPGEQVVLAINIALSPSSLNGVTESGSATVAYLFWDVS